MFNTGWYYTWNNSIKQYETFRWIQIGKLVIRRIQMTVQYHGMVKYINVPFWDAIKQAWNAYWAKKRNPFSLTWNEGGFITLTITF